MRTLPAKTIKKVIFFAVIVFPISAVAIQLHAGNLLVIGSARTALAGMMAFLGAYALNQTFSA